MADFQALLAEQKRTSDILSKQRNPLDARTGAGRALLDQQKQTNEKLDRIVDATDTSLVEENLANLAEIFNARLLQSKDERFQESEGITKTDNLLSNQPNEGEGLYDIQKKHNDASLPLLEKMANSMKDEEPSEEDDGDGRQSRFKLSNILGSLKSIPTKLISGFMKVGGMLTKGFKSVIGGIKNALSGLFSKFFGGFKFLLTTAATVLALGLLIKFLRSPEWKEMQKNLVPKIAAGLKFLAKDLVPMLIDGFKSLMKALVEFKEDLIDILDFIPGINIRTKEEREARKIEESLQGITPEEVIKRRGEVDTDIANVQMKLKELEGVDTKKARRERFDFRKELEKLEEEKKNLQFFDEKGNILSRDKLLIPILEQSVEEQQQEIDRKGGKKRRGPSKNRDLEIQRLEEDKKQLKELRNKQSKKEEQELILKRSDTQGKSGDVVIAQNKNVDQRQDNTFVAYGKPSFHDTALSHFSTSQYT